jgi:hypothetical protein
MKTAWEGKAKWLECVDGARQKHPGSITGGLEARESPAVAGVFFLDFPVDRTFHRADGGIDQSLWEGEKNRDRDRISVDPAPSLQAP